MPRARNNIVLWLPQQKVLITGDFFGPQFPQFPNIFTMRGEKVRKPVEYIASLDKLIALEPEIIIPSHLAPTVGKEEIREGMQRIRDAVQYVHDETIAGMNAGKTVYQLMEEIHLTARTGPGAKPRKSGLGGQEYLGVLRNLVPLRQLQRSFTPCQRETCMQTWQR